MAVAHEEHGPVLGVPDHAQALEAAAAAILAGAARGGLDLAAEIDEGLGQLPDLHVAHVAFRVPDGGGVGETVLHGGGARAVSGAFERVHGMDLVILVEAAALEPVGGVGVARIHLLQIAAPEIGARQAAPQGRPGRDQEVPAIGEGDAAVVRVHPGALGQAELGAVGGAVIDHLGGDEGLGHHHPDARGEAHLVGVVGVPAPAAGAFEVEAPGAILADGHLAGRVHDGVELGEVGGHPHVLMGVGHVHETDLPVGAGDGHGLDAGLKAEPPVLHRLVGELPIGVDAFLGDHLFHQFADHVAAGDAGALVQHPVAGGAHHALALVQPVAEQFVIGAHLAAGDGIAVAEALHLPRGHGARADRAGVDDVGDTAHPADQLAFPEDGHNGVDVARVDVPDERVVVTEDVLVGDARIGLPIVLDHVFDRGTHGAHMDDDPGGGEKTVARRVVEGEAELALLLDDGGGGDFLGGLSGIHHAGAQAGEELVVEDGLALAQLQLIEPCIAAGGLGGGHEAVAMLFQRLAAAHDAARRTLKGALLHVDVHGFDSFGFVSSKAMGSRVATPGPGPGMTVVRALTLPSGGTGGGHRARSRSRRARQTWSRRIR